MTAKEQLLEVNTAISKILMGGQEYRIGTRSLTRADLGKLLEMQKDLQAEIVNGNNHLKDNTYLAVFEGR